MDIERLTVKVHLLGEPCLWCWEIVDVEDDALVESSWATEWTGYASSREALRAGTLRLTDLTRSSRGAPLHARRTPAAGQRNQTRYLVVVARAATELYTSLKRTFEDSDSIEVTSPWGPPGCVVRGPRQDVLHRMQAAADRARRERTNH